MIAKQERLCCNKHFAASFSSLEVAPTDRRNGRRRVWRLLKDFDVNITFAGGDLNINIPSGYETDFASIPLFVQLFIGGRDDLAVSSVVHDWCCDNLMPSWWSNSLMRTIMELNGHPKWKCIVVFAGLMCVGYGSATFNFFTRGVFKRDAQIRPS